MKDVAQDLYAVLGVPKGADADAIKRAYRKLAQKLHPDKHAGDAKAEARFKAVNHAYDVLSDDKKRKLYDEFGEEGLREGFDPDRVRAYKQWSSQQRPGANGGWGAAESVRLEDLFSGRVGDGGADIFGDLFGRAGRRRGPMKGPDLESEVTIDFASSVRGATLELRPRGTSGEPVTVRIPPGADEGSRVRIAGQGAPSPTGGPPGDLVLAIHVSPHPHFRREGDNLHVDIPVTPKEAYAGAKVRVPTIDGSVQLKVPEGTQSGSMVRLRGKGVAKKGRPAGDLYVHFQIILPTERSPEIEALVDRLSEHVKDDPRASIVL